MGNVLILLRLKKLFYEGYMIKSLFAVIIGGSVGCTLRWLLSTRFNSLFPNLPPGTLVVNLLAGLIIGAALAYFLRQPHLDPFWKLMITTGLCGGLSTFSTFSVEIFALLQTGNYIWALTSVLVHVIGSLIMTALGFFIITTLLAWEFTYVIGLSTNVTLRMGFCPIDLKPVYSVCVSLALSLHDDCKRIT